MSNPRGFCRLAFPPFLPTHLCISFSAVLCIVGIYTWREMWMNCVCLSVFLLVYFVLWLSYAQKGMIPQKTRSYFP